MSDSPDLPLEPPVRPSAFERAYPFLVTALLLLGAFLRVRAWSFARSFWSDEAMLALGISGRPLTQSLDPLAYGQVAPPGFVFLVRACEMAFGSSERALRGISLGAGLVSLPLFASVARRLLTRPAALFALAAFAMLGPLVYYANELKPYALDVTIALAILRIALAVVDAPMSGRRTVLYALLGAAFVWCSYPAVFCLAGASVALGASAMRRRRGGAAIGRLALVSLVWAGSFAALYGLTSRANAASEQLQEFWQRARAPWPGSSRSLAWYVEAYFGAFLDPVGFVQPALAAAAALVGVVVVGRGSLSRIALLLLPVALTLLASRMGKYPFSSRLILFLVPSALLLVAAGLDELRRIPGKPVWFVVGTLVLLLQPAVAAVSEARHPRGREEIRPVLRDLVARVKPGDAVYVYEYGYPQFRWYAAHGLPLPADVRVVRAAALFSDVEPGVELPDGATYRFSLPVSLNEALTDEGPAPVPDRVWTLFTHVITWKGRDEERIARSAFTLAGYSEDLASSLGLHAPGASAYLYVRSR